MKDESAQEAVEPRRVSERTTQEANFEDLLVDLSTRFVNVPADQMDGEMEDAQRRVCECLGLELSSLWERESETSDTYLLTCLYRPLGGPPVPARMNSREYFPWCHQQLTVGNVVAVSSKADLPPEAAGDKSVWLHYGVRSTLVLPLSTGGDLVNGCLSFDTMREERTWPKAIVRRLQLVAQLFANALARRRSERALREGEEISRVTFEQTGVAIAHVGTDGRWLRVSDKLCAIVGHSREALLRSTFQDITHPEDLPKDLDHFRQAMAGGMKTYSSETRFIREDRSVLWANLIVSIVRSKTGEPRHVIFVVEDIADREKAENELQRLRLQLWHADRVAQIGAITASIAHELNQPLAAILSNAQAGLRFMAGGNPDLGEIRDILTDIVRDDKRAGAVVSELRSLLRRRETQREIVDLADTTKEVLNLLRGELLARHVAFSLRQEFDAAVAANKAQIQQVILNLVMNALEVMQGQPAEQRRLELALTRTDAGHALVAVRDSGSGVPEDVRENLFEAFWTTKDEGMGIGLSISRSIVESHGGQLWFENNPDRGATFFFTLPLEIQAGV